MDRSKTHKHPKQKKGEKVFIALSYEEARATETRNSGSRHGVDSADELQKKWERSSTQSIGKVVKNHNKTGGGK